MRFLVDESLQQHVALLLEEMGHDATHVLPLGMQGAPDDVVLARAAAEDRVLVTADTDFGTLLALSGAGGPSVVLLRAPGRRAHERALLVDALRDNEDLVHAKAVVTVEADRIRVRRRPITRP